MSCQIGDLRQWSFSNKKGPNLPILVKNSGEQRMPMPEAKGLKFREKGRENNIEPTITMLI